MTGLAQAIQEKCRGVRAAALNALDAVADVHASLHESLRNNPPGHSTRRLYLQQSTKETLLYDIAWRDMQRRFAAGFAAFIPLGLLLTLLVFVRVPFFGLADEDIRLLLPSVNFLLMGIVAWKINALWYGFLCPRCGQQFLPKRRTPGWGRRCAHCLLRVGSPCDPHDPACQEFITQQEEADAAEREKAGPPPPLPEP